VPAVDLLTAGTATVEIRLDRNYVSPSGQASAREMEDRQAFTDDVGRQRIIERPRLTRLLDESPARILMLVAPAGYGKTTLARQWLANRPHAWYRCSSASADVAALALGLASAISTVLPGAGERMANRLRATGIPEGDVDVLADMLAEDIREWPGNAWLAIDDYQFMDASDQSRRFAIPLMSLPNLPVLLTTRARPHWATTRRLIYGEIQEFDRSTLAMTHEEASLVLGGDGKRRGSDLATLAQGWPAVIGLAAITESREPPKSTLPLELHDYFAEELYQAASPAVQAGLARLSLVPSFNRSFAEDLLRETAADTVKTGARLGFLRISGVDRYECHPLLRTFLEAKLREAPDDVLSDVILSVGTCLIQYAKWDEAFVTVERFFNTAVFQQLVQIALPHIMRDARLSTLDRWVEFAATNGVTSPFLELAEAELCFRRGQRKRSQARASRAAQLLPAEHPLRVVALLLAGSSAHLNGADDDAIAHYNAAFELATSDNERWEALLGRLIASTVLELDNSESQLRNLESLIDGSAYREASYAAARFSLDSRLRTLRGQSQALGDALHVVDRIQDPVKVASLLYAYAQALVSEGRYHEALKAVGRTTEFANKERLRFVLPYASLTGARAELGLRHFGRALDSLGRVRQTALEAGDDFLSVESRVSEARVYLTQRLNARALELLGEVPGHAMARGEYGEYLSCRALALVTCGDADTGLALARRAGEWTKSPHVRTLAPCIEALAALQRRSGDADLLCNHAFDVMRETGDVDAFVLAYRNCPDLLMSLDRRDDRTVLIAVLRNARDEKIAKDLGLPHARVAGGGASPLSRREKEVLNLVAQGLTNRQIASVMYIEPSTAKVHLRHIFEKLDVKTRLEAVKKGQASGLLD
jgi:LuxR family maltose regulon positive regulatory protein